MTQIIQAAIVTRPGAGSQYLKFGAAGQALWVNDAERATPFGSMREAARVAARLPANLRAFSLPLHPELTLQQAAGLH